MRSTGIKPLLRKLTPLALLAALIALPGCDAPSGDHGHDHGADAHDESGHDDHGEGPALLYTHYSNDSELFVEFSPLVAGQGSRFAAHVTRLSDYSPVREGRMDVVLSREGKTAARFRVEAPARPGIFTPLVTPREAGDYELTVEVSAPGVESVHSLGQLRVFPAGDTPRVDQPEPEGDISYLKEQQWASEFAAEPVEKRSLRGSIYATAQVRSAADRSAEVRGPAEGQFVSVGDEFPAVGAMVKQGQMLGRLRPRLGGGVDLSTLREAVDRSAAQRRLAEKNLSRLRGLLEDGAVPRHRVHEAETELETATAALKSARAQLQQFGGGSQAGVPVIAPIDGKIVSVGVAPGEYVSPDQSLMQIASGKRNWLEARIAEADAGRLRKPSGAWFETDGEQQALIVGDNARLVTAGGVIDPVSRTVPVIFEFESTDSTPLLNRGFDARVYTGETVESVAIPRSALLNDGGQSVVYVQTGGETFARRAVQLGLRGVDYIAVTDGVSVGEHVVSKGAYLVRLAGASSAETGHGHAH